MKKGNQRSKKKIEEKVDDKPLIEKKKNKIK